MRYLAILLCLCGVALGQVEFDGVDDYIAVDDNIYMGTNSAFTISMWINTTNNTRSEYFLSHGDVVGVYQFRFYKSSNGLTYIGLRGSASTIRLVAYADITYDGLTHLALVYHGGVSGVEVFDLVVNGENVEVLMLANNLATDFNSVGKIYVANSVSSLYFDGKITDARIYTRALSAAEISEIYNCPWSLTDDPSLVLRTCIVTNDTGATLTGVAKNYGTGADGTYNNSPTAAPWTIQVEKPRRATINID